MTRPALRSPAVRPNEPTPNGRERGFVGGLEVLPFGLLVLVVGSLLLANAWAVVDAKMAVDAAAAEAARAYVEAPSASEAGRDAARAAGDAIRGAGRDPSRLHLRTSSPGFERCARVEEVASYTVPAISLPFVGGFGNGIAVTGRHAEIIDPFADSSATGGQCGF